VLRTVFRALSTSGGNQRFASLKFRVSEIGEGFRQTSRSGESRCFLLGRQLRNSSNDMFPPPRRSVAPPSILV
jgi:hypothetical protein